MIQSKHISGSAYRPVRTSGGAASLLRTALGLLLWPALLFAAGHGTVLAADSSIDSNLDGAAETAAMRAAGQWPLWAAFLDRFVDREQGRVMEPTAESRTTSEAQAYGLFFSLVAGDRESFDRILNWTTNNLASGDLGKSLPAWLWGQAEDGAWQVLDPNSASDADLWLSYTLLEAGRLWNDPPLAALGREIAQQIDTREVVEFSGRAMLLPGAEGFLRWAGDDPSREVRGFYTNPSYLTPQLIARLSHEMPEARWAAILAEVPRVWSEARIEGFPSDWAYFESGTYRAEAPPHIEAAASYDAIRVYLWAGMLHPDFAGRDALLKPLDKMLEYLRDHAVPPELVPLQGEWKPQGGVGFSAALLPLLAAGSGGDALDRQREVVRIAFDGGNFSVGGEELPYYDHCLYLFAQGFDEGWFRFGSRGQLNVSWRRPAE